jgi:hypothetical protein
MAERSVIVVAAWAILSLWVTAGVGLADEETELSYRDEFNSISYSGNDGTHDFTWKWEERGDDGGPVGGLIRVDSPGCSGNCLTIGGDGAYLETISITRLADTQGADGLRLTYDYLIDSDNLSSSGGVRVMVSSDAGQSWASVRYYPIASSKNQETTISADIADWASSELMIGFFGVGTATGHISFDNIEVSGTVSPPATTTTTSTTTTAAATTTTVPPTNTTTTVSPTTTAPPQAVTTTTSTTVPPTTTSTSEVPGSTTPTTTPGGAEPQSQADLIAAGSRYTDKADLMTTDLDVPTGAVEQSEPATISASPIEHATTGITIAASTLRTNALAAFVLGILIALLALRGLSRFDDRDA